MHAPVLVTPPAVALISPAEAKAQCRVDGSDEDALLDSLVAAATAHLDGWTGILGRCLVTQTWSQAFDVYGQCLRLPMQAQTAAVTVIDADGDEVPVADSDFDLLEDSLGSYVRFADGYGGPASLAEFGGIVVEFTAGYGAAADVPAAIRQAALLLVGHWYANREAVNVGNIVTAMPMAVEALLAPYRRVGV